LASSNISIEAMMQKETAKDATQTDIVMLTHQTQEKNIDAALQQIEALSTVFGKVTKLRLETLD
jgi:homoserine dehydrogenase